MNGKLARKIRKEVFEDKSRRIVEYTTIEDDVIVCTGLRAKYKKFKKELKKAKRNN